MLMLCRRKSSRIRGPHRRAISPSTRECGVKTTTRNPRAGIQEFGGYHEQCTQDSRRLESFRDEAGQQGQRYEEGIEEDELGAHSWSSMCVTNRREERIQSDDERGRAQGEAFRRADYKAPGQAGGLGTQVQSRER
jgi:hypothetical protein